MFATSRISAVILVSRDNSANPDISRNFCLAIWIFFQISDCGSYINPSTLLCKSCPLTKLVDEGFLHSANHDTVARLKDIAMKALYEIKRLWCNRRVPENIVPYMQKNTWEIFVQFSEQYRSTCMLHGTGLQLGVVKLCRVTRGGDSKGRLLRPADGRSMQSWRHKVEGADAEVERIWVRLCMRQIQMCIVQICQKKHNVIRM